MSVACPALVLYIHQCAPHSDHFSLSTPTPIGECLDSERLSSAPLQATSSSILSIGSLGLSLPASYHRFQHAPSLPVFILKGFSPCGLPRLNSGDNHHAYFRYLPEEWSTHHPALGRRSSTAYADGDDRAREYANCPK